MSGPRPAAVTVPFVALASVAAAMHVISRTTGSGWLVVVVSFVLSVLGLAVVLPALALLGADAGVRCPADATAGSPVTATVETKGRARAVQLRLVQPASDWVRLDGPGAGPLRAVPERRGVLGQVDVELRSAAPFGLVVWRRRLRVALPDRPLEVGPAPHDVVATPPQLPGEQAEAAGRAGRPVTAPELPRGVRDYVAGDPPRLVSWVATARHGRLMVKEMEGGGATSTLVIVVDLRGGEAAAEEAASRAAGIANAALARGTEVVMATAEAGGPRLGRVTSPVEVGRRLARATADGPPAEPPAASAESVRVAAR